MRSCGKQASTLWCLGKRDHQLGVIGHRLQLDGGRVAVWTNKLVAFYGSLGSSVVNAASLSRWSLSFAAEVVKKFIVLLLRLFAMSNGWGGGERRSLGCGKPEHRSGGTLIAPDGTAAGEEDSYFYTVGCDLLRRLGSERFEQPTPTIILGARVLASAPLALRNRPSQHA